jgi:hypothetical protein
MSTQAATHTHGEAPAATQASSGSGVEGGQPLKKHTLERTRHPRLMACSALAWGWAPTPATRAKRRPRKNALAKQKEGHLPNAERCARFPKREQNRGAERLKSEPGSARQQKHGAGLRAPLETRQKAAAAMSSFMTMLARLTNTPPNDPRVPRNYVQGFGGGRLNSHAR